MSAKELVKAYYEADLSQSTDMVEKFLHPDCKLHWHSSQGYSELGFKEMQKLHSNMQKSYKSTRTKVSHLTEEDESVTARYTMYVTPVETPDEEQPFAHFITIWKVKDGKLYRGYEISQPAQATKKSLASFNI